MPPCERNARPRPLPFEIEDGQTPNPFIAVRLRVRVLIREAFCCAAPSEGAQFVGGNAVPAAGTVWVELSVRVVVCVPSGWSVVVSVLTSLRLSPVLFSDFVSVRVVVCDVGCCLLAHAVASRAATTSVTKFFVFDMHAHRASDEPREPKSWHGSRSGSPHHCDDDPPAHRDRRKRSGSSLWWSPGSGYSGSSRPCCRC
jgi:hypothetical protein